MIFRQFFQHLHPFRLPGAVWRWFTNWRRRRHKDLDYILLNLPSNMPALPESRDFIQRRLFGKPPLSLWELKLAFERLAADPRPKGIVISLHGLEMSLADLQTLRGMLQFLRERGKRVIAHAQLYDTAQYYLASAADEILLQPSGDFMVTGMAAEAYFLKDALAQAGVTVDVIAITPYKGAFDQFSLNEISPEGRAQLEWLLDSRYQQIVRGIAEGRGLGSEAVQAMIDHSPQIDTAALAAKYVDALAYENELPAHLSVKRLVDWQEAQRKLFKPPPKPYNEKYVALLRVEGMMVSGESGGAPGDIPIPIPVPFLGEDRSGDITVVQQIRAIMQDDSAAAVVLYIDSGGGAVSAASAMGQALDELARTRPLVAYMNGVAASGGYWVAASSQHIYAQPGTITGSIGVVMAKPVAGGLLEKFQINAAHFKRGANADIYDVTKPFNEAQRLQMRASIDDIYRRFVERVAAARKLSFEAVDAISGGRVWTGEQALENGLVDALGGLETAVAKARELANLPAYAPVIFWEEGDPLPPQIVEAAQKAARNANPAVWIGYLWENAMHVASSRAQAIMPFRLQ
ncbi:MAG: signal peptide peptidase SppA [Anaerolineae bacterium]|nr:signal peptide peptidase SppA [Anaerolineae bacterium]